ncbi:MAG: hypothetical protein E7445_05150 [Ruminococcaceae bacterium]|nr:hypothetical protein [Oscillospiraceae bacterium]
MSGNQCCKCRKIVGGNEHHCQRCEKTSQQCAQQVPNKTPPWILFHF